MTFRFGSGVQVYYFNWVEIKLPGGENHFTGLIILNAKGNIFVIWLTIILIPEQKKLESQEL